MSTVYRVIPPLLDEDESYKLKMKILPVKPAFLDKSYKVERLTYSKKNKEAVYLSLSHLEIICLHLSVLNH